MKFYKANTTKFPLRSLLAAVCAWTILVSLVSPAMATEVPEATPETAVDTTVETTAAAVESTETTIPPTTATIPETTAETEVDSGLEESLRAEIAAYNERNGISPEMPDSALANAYFALDSDGAKAAWEDAHSIIDRGADLTAEEADTLQGEKNTKLFLRFYNVMENINTPMLLATTGPHIPVEGVTVTIANGDNDSMSSGIIEVKAATDFTAGTCGGSDKYDVKTVTITIEYDPGDETKTLTFNWSHNGNGTVTIGETQQTITSDTYPPTDISASGKIVITMQTIEGDKNATECKLTLSGFSFAAPETSANITVNYDNTVGSVVTSGQTTAITSGEAVPITEDTTFTAIPAEGATFLGWLSSDNTIISESTEYTAKVALGNQTLTPMFAKSTAKAWFLAGGVKYYDDLNVAAEFAATASDKKVIPVADGTLHSGDYSIPSGVTLLIPFDASNTLITNNMGSHVATANDAKTEFRRLTMASGASITVNGTLCVGSRAYRQMTGQVGPYGVIAMDSGSSITIESSAFLYAWGYIFPGSGDGGTVTINDGGTVYESAMMMDYPNSAGTTQDLYQDNNIFPLRAFTMRNVEVPMTFHYGGVEYIFYCLYSGTLNMTFKDNVLLIGKDSTAPFQLHSGASLEKSYSGGKQIIKIQGNSALNAISLSIQGVNISSAETTGFPLPSGYDVEISGGTMTLGGHVIMTEGTKITIAEDATVDTNGKNLYVFDSSDDAGTVAATDVHGTSYTIVNTDAVLDVNGTLKASGGFYTSTGGAAITSSEGTGKIELTTASSATTINIKTGRSTASTYDVTPAKLKNGDGSYTETATGGTGTYVYSGTGTNGKWYKRVIAGTSVRAGDCLDIYFWISGLDGDGYTAKINDGNSVTEITSDKWVDKDGYRRFCYSGITAKEMTDVISVTIYDKDGKQVSETATESIESYALRALEKNSNTYLQTALVDMLNYGAAAQVELNHNTGTLANAKLTDKQKTYGTSDDVALTQTMTREDGGGISFTGASITAGTTLYLNFYFDGIPTDKSNIKAVITYTDHYKTARTREISGSAFKSRSVTENSTTVTYWGPQVTGLAVADGRQKVTCQIQSNGTTVATATASVEAYANQTIKNNNVDGGDAELVAVCKALMKFVDSAKAYFDSENAT